MKATVELCLDHDSSIPGRTAEMHQKVLDVIGHDPVNCAFVAASREAVVHGAVEQILWCDSRILGVDKIGFRDGRVELASAENIGAWFEEQGHRLMKIEGFKAFGNTIVRLNIVEVDEPPTRERKTTLKRPKKAVALEVIEKRLSQLR